MIYYIIKIKVYPKIELRIAKNRSVNLIFSKNKKNKHKLIICGHYDSSKVMRKFIQKNLKLIMNMFPIISLAFYSFILLIFLKGFLLLHASEFNVLKIGYRLWMNGFWGLIWYFFTIGSGTISLILSYILLTSRDKYSNGADDNASGIAVMIKVASALKTLNLRIGVDFIFFTGEERGAWGSRNWVNEHINDVNKDTTYFLNIDCVGRGERFFITKGSGKIFKKKSDSMLCDIAENVCDELKYESEESWGTISDDKQLIENNLRTCSIMRCNVKKINIINKILRKFFLIPIKNGPIVDMKWIHTENDIIKYIDEYKLKETVKLVIKIIKKLDERLYYSVI
jgi:hypothetical protein